MKAKFNMTVEENIFVAKRNIIDYMWKSARLEGIGVTYPDTEAIYNGLTVQGVSVKDTVAINNLKHSWSFLLENVDYPTDYPFICKINQLVGGDNLIARAGFIRNVTVSIGGTTWKPDIPIESIIKEEIADISTIESPTERAIALMLYCMRRQMFLDGNKRTGMLAGNHVMIAHGAGIIAIPIEHQREFTALLIRFYETNKMEDIINFVYDRCIDGIDFDTNSN
ncbi:MAG TPA: cell filamentation protein Fic [Desulfosporosinus sp.]|jgi:Fic family protein|nr:cell filamentation protein Fic [Desulfosporosinus sp.]